MRRNPPSNRPEHPDSGTEKELALLESYGWTVVSSGEHWSLTCQAPGKGFCLGISGHDTARSLKRLLVTHKTMHPKSFP